MLLRPDGRIWLMIKRYYPSGAYRLPTGGIKHGEPVLQALVRETYEETGWRLPASAYLADIRYRFELPAGELLTYRSHAFLLACGDAPPTVLDTGEEIDDFRSITVAELVSVADFLEGLPDRHSDRFGSWRDWGAFRAVVHRVVAAALAERGVT